MSALEQTENQELVTWALTELTAFWQGLTDEARDRLGKYSFISRRSEEKQSTDDSPVPLRSNEDGELQDEQPENSLEVSDTPEVSQSINSNYVIMSIYMIGLGLKLCQKIVLLQTK